MTDTEQIEIEKLDYNTLEKTYKRILTLCYKNVW